MIFLILLPYFTADFLDLKQEQENIDLEKRLKIEEALKRREQEEKMKAYLLGKFDPSQTEGVVEVPKEYNIIGRTAYIQKDALNAFIKMAELASKENIKLYIASAARNFDDQKKLWEDKWNGLTLVNGKNLFQSLPDEQERFEKILEYSATPGTSRHHFGTDIDINGASLTYFATKKGQKEYEWLTKNASLFGFCQTYNLKDDDRVAGYNEEKWHFSYLPLARDFTEQYEKLIKQEDIKGFLGDQFVPAFNIINNYVLTINPDCI